MREEQSDRILDLVQSAAGVESEIETHTEEVAAGLGETFAGIFEAWGDGQEPPDFRANLRALKDKLGDSREALSQAEERHIGLIRQAVARRGEREELTGGLYDDFSSMRRTVEELYHGKGKGNVNAFVVAGIQGPTAQWPTKLLRQVDLAIGHLRQPGLEFPQSRFGETRLEPTRLADALQPRSERLHLVQADLRRLRSELNASRKEKNRALDAHKETFLWVARAAESYFHLAGEHELAARIRPSARRPGRRAVEVADDQQGEPETGASPAEGAPEGTPEGAPETSTEATSGENGSGDQPASQSQPATGEAPESAPSPPAGG